MFDQQLDAAQIKVLPPDAWGTLPDELLGLRLCLALDRGLLVEMGPQRCCEALANGRLGDGRLQQLAVDEPPDQLIRHAFDLRGRGQHRPRARRGWPFVQACVDTRGPQSLGKKGLPDVQVGRPDRIRPGDTVGVVAPAGVVDGERLGRGVKVLEGWGLRVVTGEAVLQRHGYLAGTDQARRNDLQRMLADPAVRALIAARGGFGCQRLVPHLDLSVLRDRPKPLVGFSDVTALLMAWVEAGTLAIHGPMVAADLAVGLSATSLEHLWRLLSDPTYCWEVPVPVTVRPGRATGRLLGGCLSVLATLLGTPWAPSTRGAVLFLEDVNEWPYRVDRLLTQLRQAGVLGGLAGLVLGSMEGCPEQEGIGVLDVVREAFADAPFPVGFGVPAGHRIAEMDIVHVALPLGVPVELDTERGVLRALASAVL